MSSRQWHASGRSTEPLPVQVVTEKALVEQSGSFEQAVMSNEKAALANFCASKAAQAATEERECWAFMQVLFQDDSRTCVSSAFLPDGTAFTSQKVCLACRGPQAPVAVTFVLSLSQPAQPLLAHSAASSCVSEPHHYSSDLALRTQARREHSAFQILSAKWFCRHLMAHLGFQDMIPQADGAAEDASLAANAESLQLTSPRSAPGASPSHRMPEANGNAFKEEGSHHSAATAIAVMSVAFESATSISDFIQLQATS